MEGVGQLGIYSFNGNKIITTSGGGMLVSDNEELIAHARKLATQGRGQVAARRRNFDYYEAALGGLPGVAFMPECFWGRHTRWLTTLTIDAEAFGATREDVRLALVAANIESHSVWKPMHMLPAYAQYEAIGGEVAERLFRDGLCLPSGSQLTEEELERVVGVVRGCCRG